MNMEALRNDKLIIFAQAETISCECVANNISDIIYDCSLEKDIFLYQKKDFNENYLRDA